MVPLETHEQIAFVNWFERQYPKVFIHAIPNGLHIGHRQREKASAEGVRKGPSDLHVPEWRLYVEMKRQKGSRWDEEQKKYKRHVEKGGGTYLLCLGFEDAKRQLGDFLAAKYPASQIDDDSPRQQAIGQNGNDGEHYEETEA